jgi:multiple sugar transport system substrate-binding protein
MKRYPRGVPILLPLLALFLLQPSCRTKAPPQDVTVLQFWNFGGTPAFMEWVRERTGSFNAAHPRSRVEISQKSWNMIRELLVANFSSGGGPDVMTLHANHAAEFGEPGYFYCINRFPDFEEVRGWYEPNLFEATRYKGNYYGLPGSAIAFVLVCNKDLFDAAGIAPPRTWTEFREAARRLTKDTDGDGQTDQYGLILQGGDRGGFSYRLAPFLYKAGVSILSDDNARVEFNSPRGVSALKLFADMHQVDHSLTPGFLAYTLTEVNDMFCSNRVAMSIEGPWFRSMVDSKKPGKEFYTVPVPVPDDMLDRYDTAPTLQDMVMYSINARSRQPDVAWEFIKYLRNEEADLSWIRSDLGGIATTRYALTSPAADSLAHLSLYRNELAHARPWPPHRAIIAIAKNILAPCGQMAIVGELTPQEAMDRAEKEATKLLREGR